ncbi:hypothetical protein [Hymenobacter sp. AT01-02]|uniref:hypothetical protein n=1 Tax=Hymenobacter sp. AT01-02 TaxID=1571877 RepID=UPI0005F26980|nr:hypothetical protein [Hymenobacter sp. AT01-02]
MPSKKSFQLTLLITNLFITCPSIALAQALANNTPGYIVTIQGDTIKGTLTVPRFATTEGVILHQTSQSAEKKYTVQDLRAFGLQDGRRFVKRTIPTNRNSESGVVDSSTVFFQHLVAGEANFYRYDFNAAHNNPNQLYASSETAQYFIDIANSSPVGVQRRTHQATLAALFKDCLEVVKLIPRTTFTERGLSNLALRYDTLCQASTKAYDYRLPEERNTTQLLVSLRAGLQNGQLSYRSSDYF